jgi:outer membrane receptor protein involved in Fe transport
LIASLSLAISREVEIGAELELRNAKQAETDQQVPMVAPLSLAVTGTYHLTPQFAIDARLVYADERQTVLTGDPSLQRTIPSHLLLDLGAAYQFGERFQLFAEVTNLLAQQYEWWEGYKAPGLELRGGARIQF